MPHLQMSFFIKFILHEKHDTHAHKGIKRCHCLEHASVNSKTPGSMARLSAEERERERERAIGMVQLGVSYTHVIRILNSTKLMITILHHFYNGIKLPLWLRKVYYLLVSVALI